MGNVVVFISKPQKKEPENPGSFSNFMKSVFYLITSFCVVMPSVVWISMKYTPVVKDSLLTCSIFPSTFWLKTSCPVLFMMRTWVSVPEVAMLTWFVA